MDCGESLPCLAVFLQNIDLVTRVWGVFTSIVLLGVGADLSFLHQLAGGFAIAAALITFFLEMTWAMTILLQICLRYEHNAIYNCWDAVLWFDYWKRTVIYTVLATLLFAQPHREWFTTVGGIMLIALGLLHVTRWYSNLKSRPMSLLEQQENGLDDDVEIDLSLPEPILDNYSSSATTEQQPRSQSPDVNMENEFSLVIA